MIHFFIRPLQGDFQPFFCRYGKGIPEPGIIRRKSQQARNQGLIRPMSFIGLGNEPYTVISAFSGSSFNIFLAISPIRTAPAVCELEGQS